MKILIFGTGKYYQNRKQYITSRADIIAFIDNNHNLHSRYIDGFPIISPNDISKFTFDIIVLMSVHANKMKEQLLSLGIKKEKIWYWDQFLAKYEHGNFKLYCGLDTIKKVKSRVLIITTDLDYNGGSLAAVYASMALDICGYQVILAAPGGNPMFITETQNRGINVIICPALPYLYKEELYFIQQFDVVLVNVFQMIRCACEISKLKPVIWWIHEFKSLFDDTIYQFDEYADLIAMSKINILAVSNISKNYFNSYFPGRIKNTLPFGIPDMNKFIDTQNEQTHFAIIGSVIPRKAQDIFIQAIKLLTEQDKKRAQFSIIGHIGNDDYSTKIKNSILEEQTIHICGNLSRQEINAAYAEIDVVVCPSLEEPMSIVITEGMMYGKVCIVSDIIGMSAYIKDGENGFICKTGECTDLSQKMSWVINNKNQLQEMGINARKTYEKFFTLDHFGNRLEAIIQDTIHQYNLLKD